MPYIKTNWVNGGPPYLNEVNLEHLETQYDAVAADIDDPASGIGAYLSTTLVARKASPRGTQRVATERRPVFNIDQQYPNAYASHRIVYGDDATMWAVGHDRALRKSTDGGLQWVVSHIPTAANLASQGVFLITQVGTIITTSDPFDLTQCKIIRSATGGTSFTDAVAAKANVQYLGPTSICQDPITGYLYLGEYVTVSSATKPTFDILRSTDDGATWTTFHTFSRTGAGAVRHCHGIQWDQFAQRIVFACGDAEAAAGLYRVNATGDGIETVTRNDRLDTVGGIYGGAVGVMFFPDYIAWGVDQVSDSGLVRMNRDQIGAATPVVEKVLDLQSTAFYTLRTAADGTEWLMTVSNEDTARGRVDNACHIYRVTDNGSTADEVLTVPTSTTSGFAWIYPCSTPLPVNASGIVWFSTNIPQRVDYDPYLRGGSFSGRLAWGTSPTLRSASLVDRPYTHPVTVSGHAQLTALEKRFFGVTECPLNGMRLYIFETTREQFSGSGFAYVEVYDQTGAAILKMEDGTTNMQWQHRSRRAALQQASIEYVCRSAPMTAGRQIRFRFNEVLNNTAEIAGSVTYAWGW